MASSRNNESPNSLRVQVAACLRHHFPHDLLQTLVVGFSGGRDSVVLLHVLSELQSEFGYRLRACHVNHQISPHADEWQSFCARFCDERAIPLDISVVDVPRSTSDGLESAARGLRYSVFSKLPADWLILGQHRSDQAETILYNLLRGAGLRGAAAIPEVRTIIPGLRLLRPLLRVSRKMIDIYLNHHSLNWVDDESNSDIYFSRNFIRHQVLPDLMARFPGAEANLAAAAGRFSEAVGLLDDLALLDLNGEPARFPLSIARIATLSEPRGRNLLRFLLFRHGVGIPSEARLIEALRQLVSARGGRHPEVIFGDWRLVRWQNSIQLIKNLGD